MQSLFASRDAGEVAGLVDPLTITGFDPVREVLALPEAEERVVGPRAERFTEEQQALLVSIRMQAVSPL